MPAMPVCENAKPLSLQRQRRREKSRDAARCRRHKESDTFEEICNTIPIPHEAVNHLDKSAVMRMLISYIKLRQAVTGKSKNIVSQYPEIKKECLNGVHSILADDYVNALNAFLLVLSLDLDILFVSDNVKDYLGLSKLDLIGQSMLTYAHEGDHDGIRNCFNKENDSTSQQSFFLRLKSTLTTGGKSINLKSASYKVLRCSGIICNNADSPYFVAYLEPIPHPANIEHFLDSNTYVTQHSPDMKFTYCDERFSEMLGYSQEEMIDRSFFDFCHVLDIKSIGGFFQQLYKLDQVETNQFRFLAKTGGYHWMVTQATVIANQKNHKPQCVVCVHYVISGLTQSEVAFTSNQLKAKEVISSDTPPSSDLIGLSPLDSFEIEMTDYLSDSSEKKDTVKEETAAPTSTATDDCTLVPLTFTELDDDDIFSEDIYYNAPSIGDPWSFNVSESGTTDKIEDVFPDVMLDNNILPQQQQAPSTSANFPDFLQTSSSYKVAQADVNERRASIIGSPVNLSDSHLSVTKTFATISPGSRSPCDSAYGGSPPHLSDSLLTYSNADRNSRVQNLATLPELISSTNFNIQQPAYQPVLLSGDKYKAHVRNLKRGYVEASDTDGGVYQWPEKKKRFSAMGLPKADLVQHNCGVETSQLEKTRLSPVKPLSCDFLRDPNMLLQRKNNSTFQEPGISKIDSAAFLLQPEMSFTGKAGRRIARNMSSNLLPELSLHDCEVNAPLPRGQTYLPVAMDCVQALDCDM